MECPLPVPSVLVALLLAPPFVASAEAASPQVTLCHGSGSRVTAIRVSSASAPAHRAHGDTPASTWYRDEDGDGFGDAEEATSACAAPRGYVADASDCDDDDAEVNPGAEETCNGVDDDCDGDVDGEGPAEDGEDRRGHRRSRGHDGHHEGDACDADHDADDTDDAEHGSEMTTWYADADADGFGDASDWLTSCSRPPGHVEDATDCDDTDPDVNPNAAETCSPVDDDCDGVVNEPDALDAGTWYADEDLDGFGDPLVSTMACAVPLGFVADLTDCDDTDAEVHPGAFEYCDGYDDDCDLEVDEADAVDAPVWYADGDGDGWGDGGISEAACAALDGTVGQAGDCDDGDPAVSPDAAETCNGIDDNCVEGVDEPSAVDASTWYADADGDGFGDPASAATACALDGYVADGTDCDDDDPGTNPDADEVCFDAVDQDCSGAADEGCAPTDTDGDGWTADTDCDDTDPAVFPGAPETCNGVDDDCDAQVDEEGGTLGFASASDTADVLLEGPAGFYFFGIQAAHGDFDADGRGDFAISGYGSNRVYAWYGDAVGANPALTLVGGGDVQEFGQSLSAGDLDGDGYDDLVVGAADQTHHVGGAVQVFRGGSEGLSSAVAWSVRGADSSEEFGYSTALADIDADGDLDVLVGGRGHLCVFEGATDALPSTTGTCFDGWATSLLVGDFDQDGFDDVAYFQAVYPSTYLGTFVRHGSAGGLGDAVRVVAGLVTPEANRTRASDYTGDGFPDLVLSTGSTLLLYPGGSDGFASAPTWSVSGGWRLAEPGDLDGDGFDDLVTTQGGSVRVYRGSQGGLGGPEPMAFAGASALAPAGDVNGDGYADFLAGNYTYDADRGRAWLFYGGATGTCPAPVVTSLGDADARYLAPTTEGWAINVGAGDFDADGFDDVLLGGPSVSGASTVYVAESPASGDVDLAYADATLTVSGSYFGWPVFGADATGDGVDDAIVSAVYSFGVTGATYVFAGGPGGISNSLGASDATAVLIGERPTDHSGASASVGELTGDASPDMLVSSPYDATGGYEAGAVYVAAGPIVGTTYLADAQAKIVGETYADYLIGTAVGDVDGDGVSEAILGAPRHGAYTDDGQPTGDSSPGAVYVVDGPFAGTMDLADATARFVGTGGDLAGYFVVAADYDDDGYDDLGIGAQGNASGKGAVYVVLGGGLAGSGSLTDADAVLLGEGTGDAAGAYLAAGDVDGDGAADLVVGAPFFGTSNQGAAYVVTGMPLGSSSLGDTLRLEGEGTDGKAGYSVGTGFIDGDGQADVLVGAVNAPGVSTNAGLGYLFLGATLY